MPVDGGIVRADINFADPVSYPNMHGAFNPQSFPEYALETWHPPEAIALLAKQKPARFRSNLHLDGRTAHKFRADFHWIAANGWGPYWWSTDYVNYNTDGEPYNDWVLMEQKYTIDANYWAAEIAAGRMTLAKLMIEFWNEVDAIGAWWRGTKAQFFEFCDRVTDIYIAILGPLTQFVAPSLFAYRDTDASDVRQSWGWQCAAYLSSRGKRVVGFDIHWLGRTIQGGQVADPRGLLRVLNEIDDDYRTFKDYQLYGLNVQKVFVTELGCREGALDIANNVVDTILCPAQILALFRTLERGGADGSVWAAFSPHSDNKTLFGTIDGTTFEPRVGHHTIKTINDMAPGRVRASKVVADENEETFYDQGFEVMASRTGFGGTALVAGRDPGWMVGAFRAQTQNDLRLDTGTWKHTARGVRDGLSRFAGEDEVRVRQYELVPSSLAVPNGPVLINDDVYPINSDNGIALETAIVPEALHFFRMSEAA